MFQTSDLMFQNIEEWELSFIEYWFLKYEPETLPEIRENYDSTKKQLMLKNCMLLPEHYPLLQSLAKDLNRSHIRLNSRTSYGFEDSIQFVNGVLTEDDFNHPSKVQKINA